MLSRRQIHSSKLELIQINNLKDSLGKYLWKTRWWQVSPKFALFSIKYALDLHIVLFSYLKTILISIDSGIVHTDFFHLWYKHSQTKTAWECVLTNSNTTNECYSTLHCSFSPHESGSVCEFERLLLVDDLIFHTHIVSGYVFFSCKGLPVHEATVPNFLDRRKLLQPLAYFSFFTFYTGWQTKMQSDR